MLGRAADPEAVDVVVAAIAGSFTRRALTPARPGLPMIRAFRAAQRHHPRMGSERLGLR